MFHTMENGKIYPIEIKKSTDPGEDALKNFGVLPMLGAGPGEGSVLCMASTTMPLDAKNKIVPIKAI